MKSPVSHQRARHRRSHFARLLAPLAGLLLILGSAGAHAGSFARTEFINGSSFGFVGGGTFGGSSHLQGPTGAADAAAAVGPGGIGLSTFVLTTGGPVTLSALASASFSEQFGMGDQFCSLNGGCQTFGALGVSYFEFTFGIHASGSANASRTTTFDRAISTLDYAWSLTSSLGDIALGGGQVVARREGVFDDFSGSVSGGTANLRMRPGDLVELKLQATGGSLAAFNEAPASAFVDFGNTLRWDGVQSFTAFDSNGQAVNLPTGQILLSGLDTGFDYWQAAVSPLAVPEPTTALLALLGVCAVIEATRRR